MSRWLVLAVFSIAPLTLACSSSLRAGLSNAPNVGGSPIADGRANGVVSNGINDVIANGDDACGRYAEHGVLRNKLPPCPTWMPAHSIASASPAPSPTDDASRGLVEPWLNHFYMGWPCPETGAAARTSRKAHAWSSLDATVAECAVPRK